MGSDKALLSLGDLNLLQRTLQTAATVAGRTLIVGPRERYAGFGEVIEDVYPGCGPLGGIHAALRASKTELNLILSVDMPLMSAKFLAWLVEQARAPDALIVVPDALGGLQPLCAVYRREVSAQAEQALQSGDYKIGNLFPRVPTRKVSEQEIVAAGFSTVVFKNVNTSEEYQEVLRQESVALTHDVSVHDKEH